MPAKSEPPKKTYAQMTREFAVECRRLAQLCWQLYCQNVHRCLYLVGRKRADGIWAELSVAEEAPDGWQIVHGQPLPKHLTLDCKVVFMHSLLKPEPLWIYADN